MLSSAAEGISIITPTSIFSSKSMCPSARDSFASASISFARTTSSSVDHGVHYFAFAKRARAKNRSDLFLQNFGTVEHHTNCFSSPGTRFGSSWLSIMEAPVCGRIFVASDVKRSEYNRIRRSFENSLLKRRKLFFFIRDRI